MRLDELWATAGQRVCVCSFSLLPHCLQPEWAWFHGDSHRAERDRRVGSLCHYGFKASFTDGPCGFTLTVGNAVVEAVVLLLFQYASHGRQEHSCHFQLTGMRTKSSKSCRLWKSSELFSPSELHEAVRGNSLTVRCGSTHLCMQTQRSHW